MLQWLEMLEAAWVIDDYTQGRDSGLIDLPLLGEINETNLADPVGKKERYIEHKIRMLVIGPDDRPPLDRLLAERPHLLIWSDAKAVRSGTGRAVGWRCVKGTGCVAH